MKEKAWLSLLLALLFEIFFLAGNIPLFSPITPFARGVYNLVGAVAGLVALAVAGLTVVRVTKNQKVNIKKNVFIVIGSIGISLVVDMMALYNSQLFEKDPMGAALIYVTLGMMAVLTYVLVNILVI